MRPIKLILENFLSFESLEYNFIDSVVALVGLNKTDDGQGSNGSGKSSIQQGIYYAITGNNLRCSIDKKLIRKGQEATKIRLDIYCDIRKQTLSIRRELSMKGSSKLELFLNENMVRVATVKDGNDYIIDWIGITSEDLRSYYIISKESYKSFFKSSNTEKLALISRFINFSFLDKAKITIDNSISVLNNSKRLLENERSKLEGQVSVYEERLIEEENRDIDQEKKNRIKEIEKKINDYIEQIEEATENIKNQALKSEECKKNIKEKKLILNQTEKSLLKFDLTTYEKGLEELKEELGNINSSQSEYIKKQESLQKTRSEIKSELRKICINLSGTITCPKCSHQFLTLKDTTLEEEKKKKELLGKKERNCIEEENKVLEKLTEFEDLISECLSIKSEIESDIDSIREQIRDVQKKIHLIKNEIDHEESIVKSLENASLLNLDDISSFNKRIDSLKEEIEKTSEEEIKKDTQVIENKIVELEEEYQKKEKQIKDLDDKIFKKNEWINRFKDFKMYLASEQIKNIQNHANDILRKENSDLRLLIESFKKDSKGNVKDEITPYIVRDEAESFWYYSGGERVRVEIATILAIQQMINSTNPYGGLQFLFIDEITEGLSEEGLYDIIEALNFIKYPILITTHVFNQNAKCETLKIVKEDGISRLV